jgi:Carboxypeptidase regulatory-like domain
VRTFRLVFVVALIAGAGPALAQSPTVAPRTADRDEPTPGGTIAGQVVDAETGRGLAHVAVGLGSDSTPGQFTDDEGRFVFHDVPPGRYTVQALKPGYNATQFPEQRRGRVSRALEITSGSRVIDLRVSLRRAGAISGRVVDEFGDPAQWARVMLSAYPGDIRSARALEGVRDVRTNDIGEFRLAPVPAGRYQLTARSDTDSNPLPGFPTSDPGFVAWPQAHAIEHAQPLTLAAGEQMTGIELQLIASKPSKVSGVVLGVDGKTAIGAGVSIAVVGPDQQVRFFRGHVAINEGRFEVWLPPGTYELEAGASEPGSPDGRTPGRRLQSDVLRLAVSGESVQDLVLQVTPPIALTGRIVFQGSGASRPPDPKSVRLYGAAGFDQCNYQQSQVQPDYSFTLYVQGRRCQVGAGAEDPWRMQSVTASGRDITFEGLNPREQAAESLVITMSDRAPRLRLTVSDEKGGRAEEFVAFVFPADPARWSTPFRGHPGLAARIQRQLEPPQPGEELQVDDLMAGEYLVAAIRPDDYDASGYPETLDRLESIARPITLAAGETKSFTVTIAALPAQP